MMEPIEIQKTTEGSDPAPQTIRATGLPHIKSTGASAPFDQGKVAKAPDPLGSEGRPERMLDQGLDSDKTMDLNSPQIDHPPSTDHISPPKCEKPPENPSMANTIPDKEWLRFMGHALITGGTEPVTLAQGENLGIQQPPRRPKQSLRSHRNSTAPPSFGHRPMTSFGRISLLLKECLPGDQTCSCSRLGRVPIPSLYEPAKRPPDVPVLCPAGTL